MKIRTVWLAMAVVAAEVLVALVLGTETQVSIIHPNIKTSKHLKFKQFYNSGTCSSDKGAINPANTAVGSET